MLKQLSIFAENKKGNMQRITQILTDAKINIWGSVTNDSAEYGIVRMVVSDPVKAKEALEQEEYLCKLTDIVGVEMDDEVGSLNNLLKALADSNINVNYIYVSFNRETGRPVLVFHADETAEVESCIVAKGFKVI